MGPWIREDPRIIDPGPCVTSAVIFEGIDNAVDRRRICEPNRMLGRVLLKVEQEDQGRVRGWKLSCGGIVIFCSHPKQPTEELTTSAQTTVPGKTVTQKSYLRLDYLSRPVTSLQNVSLTEKSNWSFYLGCFLRWFVAARASNETKTYPLFFYIFSRLLPTLARWRTDKVAFAWYSLLALLLCAAPAPSLSRYRLLRAALPALSYDCFTIVMPVV